MNELLEKINLYKEAILLGEIGALLHMFGKASSDFLQANSLENQGSDSHQNLKHLPKLAPLLRNARLKNTFSFNVSGRQEELKDDFTDFVTKYKGKQPDCYLLRLFNACHRMTSADEKGVVRKNQTINDMWITTPFGYRTQKIDKKHIDSIRTDMDQKLAKVYAAYLSNDNNIEHLHEHTISILKSGFSQTLGETREPANDVTLWAQSHGVASLYKPVLASLAMDIDPCPKKNNDYDFNQIRWRLLGIGWNGLGFVQLGRKPADIIQRQEIVKEIIQNIQRIIEVKYPLGNLFYWDINGLFLTFPGFEDNMARDLIDQLASTFVTIVRGQSDNELWPFLTLSKPRRTLTIITQEIQYRDKLAELPRIATILSLEKDDQQRERNLLLNNPDLDLPSSNLDICPVCRFRSKPISEDVCAICIKRRSGRQDRWHTERNGQTIWMDEVADNNNRIALITLRFDLSRWLNGEWLTSLYSQTFEEWGKGMRLFPTPGQVKRQLKELVSGSKIRLPEQNGFNAFQSAESFANWVIQNTNRTECKPILESFLEKGGGEISDPGILIEEVKEQYGTINDQTLLSYFFTQNPSPARLSRIWQETEAFLETWLANVKEKVFSAKPYRLRFNTNSAIDDVQEGQTYRITISNLPPGPLVVLCLGKREFLTVDSLDKFRYKQGELYLSGSEAVKFALQEDRIRSWVDESTGLHLTSGNSLTIVDEKSFTEEPYCPFIVLSSSPNFYQMLVPANRVPDILNQLFKLYDKRFEKVRGKLPIHVSLLVTKRKFPLYSLLETGQQILSDPIIREGRFMNPWWVINSDDDEPFYNHYTNKKPNNKWHRLVDLSPLSSTQEFWLTPGYLDFDFLGSTADRYRLNYDRACNQKPNRPSIAGDKYDPYSFPLHYMQKIFDIWATLSRIGPTQRHQLEEALSAKLEEWKTVKEDTMPIFEMFGKAVLRDSFGNEWSGLSLKEKHLLEESLRDGLLLETLQFFQYIIKEGVFDE